LPFRTDLMSITITPPDSSISSYLGKFKMKFLANKVL
jgi:hypothetical protein